MPYGVDPDQYVDAQRARRKRKVGELGADLQPGLDKLQSRFDQLEGIQRRARGDKEHGEDRLRELTEHNEDRLEALARRLEDKGDRATARTNSATDRATKAEDRDRVLHPWKYEDEEPNDPTDDATPENPNPSASYAGALIGPGLKKLDDRIREGEDQDIKRAGDLDAIDAKRKRLDLDTDKTMADIDNTRSLIKHRDAPKPAGDGLKQREAEARIKDIESRTAARGNTQNVASEKALAETQAARKSLRNLDAIIADKDKFNTGNIMDPLLDVVGKVLPDSVTGLDARKDWKSRVQTDFNAIVKKESGSAVSASELTRQLVAQLNTGIDDEAFVRIAKRAREEYARDVADAEARLTKHSRAEAALGSTPQGDVQPVDDLDDEIDALLDQGVPEAEIENELRRRGYAVD